VLLLCWLFYFSRGDYEPRPEGYRGTNVHSATDWRRSNTTLDRQDRGLRALSRTWSRAGIGG